MRAARRESWGPGAGEAGNRPGGSRRRPPHREGGRGFRASWQFGDRLRLEQGVDQLEVAARQLGAVLALLAVDAELRQEKAEQGAARDEHRRKGRPREPSEDLRPEPLASAAL